MMTDPLADMLTHIRNANRMERPAVDMPSTKLKQRVAQVLKDEGFIIDFQVGQTTKDEGGHPAFQTQPDLTGPKAHRLQRGLEAPVLTHEDIQQAIA